MIEKKLNLKDTTVGELKAFLNEIPDGLELAIWETGEGMVGKVELVYNKYSILSGDISIDIEALNTIY